MHVSRRRWTPFIENVNRICSFGAGLLPEAVDIRSVIASDIVDDVYRNKTCIVYAGGKCTVCPGERNIFELGCFGIEQKAVIFRIVHGIPIARDNPLVIYSLCLSAKGIWIGIVEYRCQITCKDETSKFACIEITKVSRNGFCPVVTTWPCAVGVEG